MTTTIPARDWELTCHECDGSGHVYVKHQVAERKTDMQEFKEECECCEGRGFVFAFQDIPGIEEYVKACRTASSAPGVSTVEDERAERAAFNAAYDGLCNRPITIHEIAWRMWQTAAGTRPSRHPDDIAVDRFAVAMKAKLAKKRAEGRGGWSDKSQCTAEFLSQLLRGHVEKGDPVDVGNLAMMLHQRGEAIAPAAGDALDAARYRWLCDKFGITKLPCAIERIIEGSYVADGKAAIDAAIDTAIAAQAGGKDGDH